MPYGYEDLFVGHCQTRAKPVEARFLFRKRRKAYRDPEAKVLIEVKGPDGGWIGITEDLSSRYNPFHVTYRETKHKSRVQTIRVEIDGDRDDAMFKTFEEAQVVFDEWKTKYVCPYGRYVKENRDTQRSKLYGAERAIWGTLPDNAQKIKSIPELEEVITKLMEFVPFPIKRPELRFLKRKSGASYSAWRKRITFGRFMAQEVVAVHEFAHHVTDSMYGWDSVAHGKEYVGVYAYLMNQMYGISLLDFRVVMNQHSVEMMILNELRKPDVQA